MEGKEESPELRASRATKNVEEQCVAQMWDSGRDEQGAAAVLGPILQFHGAESVQLPKGAEGFFPGIPHRREARQSAGEGKGV